MIRPLSEAEMQRNVLGTKLRPCSTDPLTGFFRDGCCTPGSKQNADPGMHAVCAVMTAEFLAFSKSMGNDLSTPRPEYRFPGLKPGDRWCLCAARWQEAHLAGKAPKVVLDATHQKALSVVDEAALRASAVDAE